MAVGFYLLMMLGTIMNAHATTSTADTAFSFSFEGISGDELPLSQYEGKVMLIVNTASRCGFTSQYDGLQALWDAYRDDGFVVVGVPSGDFGGQELSQNKAIQEFCSVNFSIDFPMTAKTYVKGRNAHPFYQWAGENVGMLGRPRWNFHKYLIGRDGQVAKWFSSMTEPESEKLKSAITNAIAKPHNSKGD